MSIRAGHDTNLLQRKASSTMGRNSNIAFTKVRRPWSINEDDEAFSSVLSNPHLLPMTLTLNGQAGVCLQRQAKPRIGSCRASRRLLQGPSFEGSLQLIAIDHLHVKHGGTEIQSIMQSIVKEGTKIDILATCTAKPWYVVNRKIHYQLGPGFDGLRLQSWSASISA